MKNKDAMFRVAESADDLQRALLVRGIVFVEEQGVRYAVDRDEHDRTAIHVLGEVQGEPIAAGRIRFVEGMAKLERLSVRKAFRGRGLGHKLLGFMLEEAKRRGFPGIKLHAQTYLAPFYEEHGFRRVGKEFKEAGIDHVLMIYEGSASTADEQRGTRTPATHPDCDPTPHSGGPGSRVCTVSGCTFEVSEEDLRWYARWSVPPPRLCPDERARRRMAFANQRTLYHRRCDGSGGKIISNYSPEQKVPVYDIEFWFSDKWDQFASGREFDFERTFFEQFAELLHTAPRPNLQRNPQFDENSDYTNYAGKNKNCYLIFDSDKNRDCYNSYSINSCEDVADCFRTERSELCYECVDCSDCYRSSYLQNCDNCSESMFMKNCIGCSNCFACVNLRNKSYHVFNEKCSKEEFLKQIGALQLDRCSSTKAFRLKFSEFVRAFPQRSTQGVQNEQVLGDYLSNCKNAYYCFDSRKLWDCRYVQQAFDDAKDCMDCTEVGDGVELLYECCYAGYGGHNMRFVSHALGQSSNLTYCYFTPHSSDCFGCVGIHHAKCCVLNKPYQEKDYRPLVDRLIEHMKRTGEWGEFFPPALAPFPYNKTHAYDYFPLTKKEALSRGYSWVDDDRKEFRKSSYVIPDSVHEVQDDILEQVLACEKTGRNFRLQRGELQFYRRMSLPVPRCCLDERHAERLSLRSPRILYRRRCAASGKEIFSTISPEQPETVLSEEEFAKSLE